MDSLIDKQKIRNRSHAIEYILDKFNKPTIRKAVILAGGQGTKMRPFTYEMPKSLLPVKGKPILEHLLNELKENLITDIILCTGYLGDKIKEYFGNGEKFGVNLTYSTETEPRQTGGALLKVQKLIGQEQFLLIHGDILTTLPIQDLIEFHQKEQSIATIALTTVDEPSEFGQLTLHGTKLVRFYQAAPKNKIQSHLVNCGIYVCEPSIFQFFPAGKKSFLFEDVIEHLIQGKMVSGFVFEGQWFDVGNPKNYEEAIKNFRF